MSLPFDSAQGVVGTTEHIQSANDGGGRFKGVCTTTGSGKTWTPFLQVTKRSPSGPLLTPHNLTVNNIPILTICCGDYSLFYPTWMVNLVLALKVLDKIVDSDNLGASLSSVVGINESPPIPATFRVGRSEEALDGERIQTKKSEIIQKDNCTLQYCWPQPKRCSQLQ